MIQSDQPTNHHPIEIDSSFESISQPIEVVDLRHLELSHVVGELDQIAQAGNFVMHGAASETIIEEFDPKRSGLGGKKQSVYASDDPRAAIFNAVYQKHGAAAKELREMDYGEGASSTMHMKRGEGHASFVIPEVQAEAVRSAMAGGPDSGLWQELFADGYVYFLPKDAFSQLPPEFQYPVGMDYTDHEWNSQKPIRPALAVQVSSELIRDLLVSDGETQNTEILTTEQLKERAIKEVEKSFDRIVPDVATVGVAELHEMAADIDDTDPRAGDKKALLDQAHILLADRPVPRQQVLRLLAELYANKNRQRASRLER